MFEQIRDRLPALPSYSAKYRVIQFEPIDASGERFTIGIIAQSESESVAIQTIQPKTLRCMFGRSYKNVQNLVSLTIGEADAFLKCGGRIESWNPPFSGVFANDTKTTYSSAEMKGVLFQAISSFSSLYHGEITDEALKQITGSQDDDDLDAEVGRLIANVKRMLPKNQQRYFQQQVSLKNGYRLNVDYDGKKLKADISNFAVRQPKTAFEKAKGKLVDIQVYRDDYTSTSLFEGAFELIIARENNLTNELEDSIGNIKKLAQKVDVPLIECITPQAIANHIKKSDLIEIA